ncbi:hypothetical protein BC826DRAFT_420028 [Russula brevipes]|nr:hypothetical protein BC826DRAFT_420028 [Russula brevipes]
MFPLFPHDLSSSRFPKQYPQSRVHRLSRVFGMRRIRQAYRFLSKESDSLEKASASQRGLYGDIHDEWGISPHLFETVPPPSDRKKKQGALKQTRSMPFFSREARVDTSDFPPVPPVPPVPQSLLPPTSRHTRKNSKVAQVLGITCLPERARDDTNVAGPRPNLEGIMSPPMFPMEDDPFSCPLGAAVVPPATKHTFRPMLSMPSLTVPTERRATHGPTQRVHASQSTSSFHVETTARRAPRPLQRSGYGNVGGLSARSHSNPPPPAFPVPGHHASSTQSLQPSQVLNLENKSRHRLVSAHATHQSRHVPAPMAAPNLRKARSSVILSSKPLPPLHAPKPVKAFTKPSAETLRLLVESTSTKPSHPNIRNGVVAAAAAAHVVWPPAPVVRPLPSAMPPRGERNPYDAAAVEAEKRKRKISEERANIERVRHERERESRRAERHSERERRERHHRRAATEGPSSRRRGREVEYRTMADYVYFPTDRKRAGVAWAR